jgi:HSP20 family protein
MFTLTPRRSERPMASVPTRREYSPFDLLRHEFASLFDRAFPVWPFGPNWELEPLGFEMEEEENEVVLRAEVPGFEMKELEVTVRGNELTILAEHKEPEKGKAADRRLERSMTLPPGVNQEKIEAICRNGVLEVHVPLVPEAKPRRIEVKT